MSLIKATRQITNRITNRILSPITSRIVGSGIGGSVASIIASARNALNIHPEQQVGATYLAQKTPTIAGVVADETPTRKDRTRLSCRASDFDGINQRFFGGNTSTGKTALSVSAWIRPTGASSRVVIAEDDASTSRSFLIYIDASNKLKIIIWNENGTKAIQVESVDAFTDSEWHHIGFTLNCATDTFLMYANGKVIDVIPIGAQSAIASINDSTQSIEVGSNGGGAAYFEGQIQQPLIYEGVWSAAQIRDLYLQQYDDIPITYGWFLNGDTASGLTSSSPALAASNSPDLYEDDAIGGGDWLNEKGWNGAAEFNGTSSWIELQSQPIDTTGDFKLSMFIKPATNGIENFLGYSATEGNCFAYMFAGGNSINLRINNINESFTFPQTTAEMREGGDLIIERVSGTTTIIYQGVTSPETLVESGLFHIETIGRERTAYFEGLIRNFVYEESGVALVNLPLFADANDISGNGDDGTDTDVTYVPIPKRWDEELDSAGQPAANSDSFGVARRDGQLVGSSNCISLDGVNQYGVVANSTDFSGEDWTFSIGFDVGSITSFEVLFTQVGGAGADCIFLYTSSGVWTSSFGSITIPTNAIVGKSYEATITKTGTSYVFTIENLTDGTTETDTITGSITATGDFHIGANSIPSNHWDGKVWNVKLDHANGFELPMAEGSGSVSYDVSGNGKNCTWTNSADWGNQSQYFWNENQGCDVVGTFDGVDDYVTFDSTISLTDDFTLSAWMRFDNISKIMWAKLNSSTDYIWNQTSTTIRLRIAGVSYQFATGHDIPVGQLVHLAIVRTGGTAVVYLNNVAGNSQAGATGTLTLTGFGKYSGNLHFDGLIAENRIYSKALSTDELTFDYTGGASGTDPTTTDLELYQKTTEGAGLTLTDSSGNGNDGTISGATADEFWGTIIPAASDGTSLIRSAPSNPAGPWLYEGLGSTYVNFDVVANANQWLEQRWQDTEGDGVGYLTLENETDLTGAFDIEFLLTTSDVTGAVMSKSSIGSVPKILFQNPHIFIRVVSSSDTTVAQPSSGVEHSYKLSRDSSGVVTLTIDGTTSTLFGGVAQVGTMELQELFASNGNSILSGKLRNLKIIDDGTTVLDFAPLLDLDLSSSVNHTTETVAGVTYNRLTDVSYTAGDTVEQPFSVNDTTAGRVSELIQFTFPKV